MCLDRYRTFIRTSDEAVRIILDRLYAEGTPLEHMQRRNEEIIRLFAEGVSKTEIGRRYGISPRRVGQIIDETKQ